MKISSFPRNLNSLRSSQNLKYQALEEHAAAPAQPQSDGAGTSTLGVLQQGEAVSRHRVAATQPHPGPAEAAKQGREQVAADALQRARAPASDLREIPAPGRTRSTLSSLRKAVANATGKLRNASPGQVSDEAENALAMLARKPS